MPFVEEKHLVDFHRHLEEKEISEERLARELRKQRMLSRKYRNINKRLLWSLVGCVVFLLAGYLLYLKDPSLFIDESRLKDPDRIVLNKGQWLEIQQNLDGKAKEVDELKNILNSLDYRGLNQETIYTVQVAALTNENVSLVSNDLVNMAVYKDVEYNKFALGNYTTLEEALKLRDVLISLGFEDAFVASYKNGKRLKIEDSAIK